LVELISPPGVSIWRMRHWAFESVARSMPRAMYRETTGLIMSSLNVTRITVEALAGSPAEANTIHTVRKAIEAKGSRGAATDSRRSRG